MSSSFPSHQLSLWKINGVEEGRGGERWDDGTISGEKWNVAVEIAAAVVLVDESVLVGRCAIHA